MPHRQFFDSSHAPSKLPIKHLIFGYGSYSLMQKSSNLKWQSGTGPSKHFCFGQAKIEYTLPQVVHESAMRLHRGCEAADFRVKRRKVFMHIF